MAKQLLMGNEAIAAGAIRAGVNLVCGYPGTPSTEILESVAKHNPGDIHVEWSVNEKAAMEVAAGAAYSGARALVTMKQVGLNVASDPLMSLVYVGVKGGLVIVVADDPGPISSQTEQDTRHFAEFAKLPVFDPSSPEEAYEMVADAFDYSERYRTPVILRPTTRVCHSCVSIELPETRRESNELGFTRDPDWIIFPRRAYKGHLQINERLPRIAEEFAEYRFNSLTEGGADASNRDTITSTARGIATSGVSHSYVCEALRASGENPDILKIATPFPFPEKLALEFLKGLDEVLVIEELDPVVEEALLKLCGKHHIDVDIKGKLTGDARAAGENSVESVKSDLAAFLSPEKTLAAATVADDAAETLPPLPIRPPVLCAGCPHRASFYAVKQALKGRKAFFSGDIGCYTLGNAMPLDMVDTCLCMGAGITIAQGMHIADPDAINLGFIGDSTFFAAGITGVVNAVYNQTDITIIVLDNSTTAMTGHQPHPGTGLTMMGDITEKISIPAVLEAVGVSFVKRVDPLDLEAAKAAVAEAVEVKGVSAVVFESPCIAVVKPSPRFAIDAEKCTTCKRCISELGCPAIVLDGDKVAIEPSLCYGCSICAQVCPFDAIVLETEFTEGGVR